jgi:hypothetical protein
MTASADLRAAFPAFADEAIFPDTMVEFWLTFAGQQCPAARWKELRTHGVMLLASHHLTLAAAAGKATDGTGGMDAAAGAVVSESKAVGSMSKSISRAGPGATADARAGHYNDTIYGKQYWSLVQTIGAGGFVV